MALSRWKAFPRVAESLDTRNVIRRGAQGYAICKEAPKFGVSFLTIRKHRLQPAQRNPGKRDGADSAFFSSLDSPDPRDASGSVHVEPQLGGNRPKSGVILTSRGVSSDVQLSLTAEPEFQSAVSHAST
jgi:hypothetical protein